MDGYIWLTVGDTTHVVNTRVIAQIEVTSDGLLVYLTAGCPTILITGDDVKAALSALAKVIDMPPAPPADNAQ